MEGIAWHFAVHAKSVYVLRNEEEIHPRVAVFFFVDIDTHTKCKRFSRWGTNKQTNTLIPPNTPNDRFNMPEGAHQEDSS